MDGADGNSRESATRSDRAQEQTRAFAAPPRKPTAEPLEAVADPRALDRDRTVAPALTGAVPLGRGAAIPAPGATAAKPVMG